MKTNKQGVRDLNGRRVVTEEPQRQLHSDHNVDFSLRSAAAAADAHLETAIAALEKAQALVAKLQAPQVTSPLVGAAAGAKLARECLSIVAKRIP
jgi:hypothetical protein